jgi:hypothetical protein
LAEAETRVVVHVSLLLTKVAVEEEEEEEMKDDCAKATTGSPIRAEDGQIRKSHHDAARDGKG